MNSETQFVICAENEGYAASLELWKVYRSIPDEKAATHQMVRIFDESGEDYLYAESSFVSIKLPRSVAEAMLAMA